MADEPGVLEITMPKDFETRSITLPSRDYWHHINSVVSNQLTLDAQRKPDHQMKPAEREALSSFVRAYADFCTGTPTK